MEVTATNILLALYLTVGIGSGLALSAMMVESARGAEPIEGTISRVIFAVFMLALIFIGIAVCGVTGPMLLSMLITEKLFEEF